MDAMTMIDADDSSSELEISSSRRATSAAAVHRNSFSSGDFAGSIKANEAEISDSGEWLRLLGSAKALFRPTHHQLHPVQVGVIPTSGPPLAQQQGPHDQTNMTGINCLLALPRFQRLPTTKAPFPTTKNHLPSKFTAPAISMAASSSTGTSAAAAEAMSGTVPGGITFPGPPPPTPSSHRPLPCTAAGGTDVALSAFLHRMLLSSPVPTLRSRRSARQRSQPSLPPVVSLESPDLRAAADVGYFHLSGHGIPPQLPSSALEELSRVDTSALRASNLSTLGFEEEEEEEQDADGADEPAMVFDVDEGGMDALPAASEYARRMRDVGMQVVALLSGCPEVGCGEEPFAEGRRKARCLVWVSKAAAGEPAAGKAKAYPYVVSLHSQWEQEAEPSSWVMDDGGDWTAVGARDGALLVTIGDIAQVWSNGKLKKVRGMARPSFAPDDGHSEPGGRLSVTVLITLPLDNVVSPLVPLPSAGEEGCDDDGDDGRGETDAVVDGGDEWRFHSFSLEDYAWRVYHERLQFKDPLVRYRI